MGPVNPKPKIQNPKSSSRAAAGVLAFKRALELKDEYRDQYRKTPRVLLAKYGFKFPPVIRKIFDDIFLEKVRRAVVCAPRGGGKTFIAAAIAFAVWFFLGWNVIIVAGSREQALRGIEYISALLGQPETQDYVGDETKTLITGRLGNWIKACPASTKAIRGLHARGRKLLLIVDEEAEVEPSVLRSALNVVRDAEVSTILRLSTYHKVIGSFADLVDNHERLGYALYKFDSFDVCTKCKDMCPNCFAAYREHRNDTSDLSKEFSDMYCQGRAHDGAGWLQIPEIRQARIEQNREWFETENMGWKPSGEGLVLPPDKVKDAFDGPNSLDALRSNPKSEIQNPKSEERWICIDWGFKGMTAVNVLERAGEDINHLDSREFSLTTLPLILEELNHLAEVYETREVYADVSHPFENAKLEEEGFDVTTVAFVAYKETGAGWLRYLFERGLFHSQKKFEKVKRQLLQWRRNEKGQIVKKDDHHCDSLLAGTKKLETVGCTARMGMVPMPEDGAALLDLLNGMNDREEFAPIGAGDESYD